MNYKLFFFRHFCKYIQQIRDDCTSSVLVDVYNLIEFFFLRGWLFSVQKFWVNYAGDCGTFGFRSVFSVPRAA